MLEVMLCGAVDTSEVRDGFVDVAGSRQGR